LVGTLVNVERYIPLSVNCVVLYGVCQSVLHEKDGVTMKARGCFRGSTNYTCTEKYKREQCVTLDSGEKVSYDIMIRFLISLAL